MNALTVCRALRTTIDSQEWATFAKFADAAAEHLIKAGGTRADAAYLCAVLTAARDHNGSVLERTVYARRIALHATFDTLTR